MVLAVYTIAIRLLNVFMHIASWSNTKAKQWVKGRHNWVEQHQFLKVKTNKRVWVHCASVGEFEQARPIIELLKAQSPQIEIYLSFFSPSGYELRKNYELASSVVYLPIDTRSNAQSFLDLVQPDVVLFIKYEFWFNYINECCKRNIPIAFASAYLPEGHWLLGRWGKLFHSLLCGIDHYFVQDQGTRELLSHMGIASESVTVNGDTRVDRVLKNAQEEWENQFLEIFSEGSDVLVVGSNWPTDDEHLLPVLSALDKVKIIVAPHEMKASQLDSWKKHFGDSLTLLSDLSDDSHENVEDSKVLYIDRIGLLAKIYRYADVAYVGGGFGAAVHNTLEPAVFRIPVLFGPKNQRFLEIQKLKQIGAGVEIYDSKGFKEELELLLNDEIRRVEIRAKLDEFFTNQQGASEDVVRWVLGKLK